jgi:hypothetical protein
MAEQEHAFADIEATLKKSAAALRDAGIPFLLGGSLAVWARGGPETRHDLDLMIKPEDAERALDVLEQAGMRTEKPPEGWLYKAWDGEVLVDLIFGPRGLDMTDEVLARGEEREVLSIGIPLMSLEDVLATKLLSFDEHNCDYSSLLTMTRALREKVDWAVLRERIWDSPLARAFLVMVEGLGIVEGLGADPSARGEARPQPVTRGAGDGGDRSRAAVRVVPPEET